ncbi:hypothetical protein M1L60_11255 [Actinoplanes sp. TRM 88003]|uniref:Transmembrane protein n=1 Tax=Paractinoplanes aksuensis TaxID=2939490 RepID=A0ABT1DK48_9ACTN|nr:hypothetical protein [Actinoplanes aksuensis]MCO8271170.1 hypothetical protein [Actinoplanes aksuensis]
MSNLGFALEGAWKVLLAGLILGAGLPALFAVGIRSMAFGAGGDAEVDHAPPHPIGRLVAYVLFTVVVFVALLGITFIVASGFGKTISFDHIYPTIVDK